MANKSRRGVSRSSGKSPRETSRSRVFALSPIVEDLEVRRLLTTTINEFGGTATLSSPAGITTGPDGNLWFTEANPLNSLIGRITPSGAIDQFSGLSFGATPTGIATGSDGNLWFTELGTGEIGRITTAGTITEFAVTTPNSQPDQITAGPDGNLWFTEKTGNMIGRITTAGAVTEFPIPTANSQPVGITVGPNGNLWFAESNTDKIGEITTSGLITEFSQGITANSAPTGITTGPDGNLWFTELGSARNPLGGIGQITVQGVVTEFSSGLTPGSGPAGITTGSDGNLWFTEQNDGKVGQITTQGVITEFSSPGISPQAGLAEITSGPDGNLWFTELQGNHVDRLTTTGTFTQFPSSTNVLSPEVNPQGIAAGPDNALWFTEEAGSKIGRIGTDGTITEFPVTVGAAPTGITLGPVPVNGGPANLWFTEPGTDSIGTITTSGVVTEFPLSNPGTMPEGITLGPDGNLWFTVQTQGGSSSSQAGIDEITPGGVVTTVFQFPFGSGTQPVSIVTGPDGNLWFTATTSTGGEIARLTPGGVISEFPITNDSINGYISSPMGITRGPGNFLYFADAGNHTVGQVLTTGSVIIQLFGGLTVHDMPQGITMGPDGNIWFTDPSTNQDSIGQLTPSGGYTLFPTPTNPSGPAGIALGPDNNLWFTEAGANQIGQVVTTQSILTSGGVNATVVATVPSTFEIATFTSASTATNAANFTAMIDYGDGTIAPGQVLPLSTPGTYEVVGSHTYAMITSYTAHITIGTSLGNLPPVTAQIVTTSPLNSKGNPIDGTAGRRSNTFIATLTDLDPTASAFDFVATVNWSDGTSSAGFVYFESSESGILGFDVYAGHTFASAGVFANSVTIVDSRNNFSVTDTFQATIVAAATFTPINEIGPDSLTPGSLPNQIALGSDGALWFTETNSGKIGRVDTSGNVTEFSAPAPAFSLPPSNPRPFGITSGPDAALWFTESGADAIGRITTAGLFTTFSGGISPGADPTGITLGPDGNLWFTETLGNRIGRITPAGVVTEFSTGLDANFAPISITTGSDGNLWFVGGSSMIGRITPQGVISEFPGAAGVDFSSITSGPDGDLWFTETDDSLIGKLDPTTFSVTEYSTGGTLPVDITTGPDGNLWFTAGFVGNSSGDQIERITTSGVITPFSIGLTPNDAPTGIVTGPDGNLYFAERADRIGQVVLPATSVRTTPPSPPPPLIQGQLFSVPLGTFTDNSSIANPTNFQALINWGDETTSVGFIGLGQNNVFSIVGSHIYQTAGTFQGTVTIENTANGAAPIPFEIIINSPITVTGIDVSAQAGASFTAPVASFVNLEGFQSNGSQYQFSINWGDNTPDSAGTLVSPTSNGGTVEGTHTYATTGQFHITTTVIFVGATTVQGSGTSLATVTFPSNFSPIVINTNDSGFGSLRQAILFADSFSGQTITFAIPGAGVHTIVLLSPLPQITNPTTIDGATQTSFEGSTDLSPLVEVDGRSVGGSSPGLLFAQGSDGSVVNRLSIYGFGGPQVEFLSAGDQLYGSFIGLTTGGSAPTSLSASATSSSYADGVLVLGPNAIIGGLTNVHRNIISGNTGQGLEFAGSSATSASVSGNVIGLDPSGTLKRANGLNGIAIDQGAAREMIGPGNIISGNECDGIDILGGGADLIVTNIIGLDASATVALGNGVNGVDVDQGANGVTIGGTVFGATNVISGNASTGIEVQGGSKGTFIQANLIGTDLSGQHAVGNGIAGILISGSSNNLIGPSNLISGNGSIRQGAGIWIDGPNSSGNLIEGNLIGTDLSGESALGNAIIGVLINEASDNVIGGNNPSTTNVISGNTQIGVMIAGAGASGNVLEGNLIGTNAQGGRAVGNGTSTDGAGVYIENAPGNFIGGALLGLGNVISGNGFDGIQVFGAGSIGNVIQRNLIGTNAVGNQALGNGGDGVIVNGSPGTMIVSNIIASNGNNGITVSGAQSRNTQILTNDIGQVPNGGAFGNSQFGILIVNGAPEPVVAGNVNANNGLGPIRDTNLAPVSTSTPASTGSSVSGTSKGKKTVKVQHAKAKPKPPHPSKVSSVKAKAHPKK